MIFDAIDYDREEFLTLCEDIFDVGSSTVYMDEDLMLMLPNVPGVDFSVVRDNRSKIIATVKCQLNIANQINDDDMILIQPQQIECFGGKSSDEVCISLSVLSDLYDYLNRD